MLMFASVAALLVSASAYGNAGGYGGSISIGGGYGGNGGSYGGSKGYAGPVQAAIQTRHNVQYRPVASSGSVNPVQVEVGASPATVQLLFRSASSNLKVRQNHQSAGGSIQETSSQDEAHILRHSVTKPIIQEIREVVTPFRKITQEIRPVQEQVNTIVARNVNAGASFGPNGNGAGSGGNGAGFGGKGAGFGGVGNGGAPSDFHGDAGLAGGFGPALSGGSRGGFGGFGAGNGGNSGGYGGRSNGY